ncbi:MAG TPA: class I SAM-dependent methyltransferase [Bacteroidales bacterium]|nr:class I SAM-dependent methyltransferase [Bacteroidales bacterium]HPF03949.1 class I SAM-dependent methyltransferase [Bacteroidales bacterium]HPJ58506.1 class I SAM-dependent methyltransferase [Bacteroidales bacterium]HPR11681.1 class I SAM-dependent methyltransferase [Bacteroidales bacterium]HRW85516.1 class I SAM-dependent methyltransferase [Bacteroidales bacterium]
MKKVNAIRCFFLLVIFQVLPGLGYSQSEPGYVPEVGQQGKDVVWVPTPDELVDLMLKTAKVTAKDYVVDLGSGDGRTVIAAAKLGARAEGVEYNPDMVVLSKRNAEREGVADRVSFVEADLYEYDLSKATVITMFLLPEINLKLRPRLLELKPGTRVVSNTFTMGEWSPDFEVTTEENWNSWNTALMWIVPAKVEGSWQIGADKLSLTQEYQMIYGSYITGDQIVQITDGRLSGNDITFRVNGNLYTGKIEGSAMTGELYQGSVKKSWNATRSDQP